MSEKCRVMGCPANVPAQASDIRMCAFHFTLFIEDECAEIRRETALGKIDHSRRAECIEKMINRGEILARVATSGTITSDELKTRIVSTVLTLINCRENMDRAALRHSASF
jgi:hypothetical protein